MKLMRVFGEDSIADDTVPPVSTDSSANTTWIKKGISSSKKKKRSRGDQFEVVMNGIMKELVSAQERNEE